MDFTNFDQMNQMISAASQLLTQTLLWVLSGLVVGLSLCSIGGALGQGWREARQAKTRSQNKTRVLTTSTNFAKPGNTQPMFQPGICV